VVKFEPWHFTSGRRKIIVVKQANNFIVDYM